MALAIYDRDRDEGKKEVDRLQRKLDLFRHVLSIQQIIELQTTGEIKEEIRLQNELSIATEKRSLEQEQLIFNIENTTNEIDALTKALEELETGRKPIIKTTTTGEKLPETIIPISVNVEEVEANLKYMASQYKKYL